MELSGRTYGKKSGTAEDKSLCLFNGDRGFFDGNHETRVRSNAGLADSWYCQAEKEMFGFVIRDKQTNIFSATQEASIP